MYKGRYKPHNPKKYHGNPTTIIYRSLWELRVMKMLDTNPNVLEWSSEEVRIPYVSPVDGRKHTYYPDFLVKAKNKDNEVFTTLYEVKPHKQTQLPKVPKRKTKRYLTECATYAVNMAKFEAAELYCDHRGYTFKILTETELGL